MRPPDSALTQQIEPRQGTPRRGRTVVAARAARRRLDPTSIASWLVPAALVVYLGMRSGGFDQRVWSEVGIVAWWFVALGLLSGLLPAARVGRPGWITLALAAAIAAWTAVGVSWSGSAGSSVIEVARAVSYVGVLAAALLAAGGGRARLVLGGVAAGVAAVAAVALLSRLHPGWFPKTDLPKELIGVEGRLAYPIGYWNGLAGLIAVGLPLLAWAALSARSLLLRGLAAAAVPAVVLTCYLTFSRGGIVAAALGLLMLVLLWERRLALIAPLAIMGAAAGLLVWQATRRPSLIDGLHTATAHDQGDALLIIVIVVCIGAGLAIAALGALRSRGRIPALPRVPRRPALALLAAGIVVLAVAFLAFDGPGRLADGFDDFKKPAGVSRDSDRLSSTVGNGRWQYWSEAVDAGSDDVLTGIGPGNFVFYWSQHHDADTGFVRDAHSLFLETFAELGIVGLVLVGGFVLLILVVGIRRALVAAGRRRLELAAATAGALAFAVAAGVDWLWELAVIPIAFLLIAAVIVAEPDAAETPEPAARRAGWPAAIAGTAVAALAIVVIAVPMLGDRHLTDSQERFRAGDLAGALDEAEAAVDLQPYDAAPRMQEAFVYEAMDPPQLAKAAAAARAATERASTNWETFYVLSRIQSQRDGQAESARRALRRARELDPQNPILYPEG